MTPITIISLLLFITTKGQSPSTCISTGSGTGDITWNAANQDEIRAPNDLISFGFIDNTGSADVCLRTRETTSDSFGPRWCVSFDGATGTGDSFIIKYTGDLEFYDGTTLDWTSNTATAPIDTSPISLCITDCGRVKLLRGDNGEELWNPPYLNSFPTTYPTCPAPSSAPSATPSGTPTSASPTSDPSSNPSGAPSAAPTAPSESPSMTPTGTPTTSTLPPTMDPTMMPTEPTAEPTMDPSADPTMEPTTSEPTAYPTVSPTYEPTSPTEAPTDDGFMYSMVMVVIMIFGAVCYL